MLRRRLYVLLALALVAAAAAYVALRPGEEPAASTVPLISFADASQITRIGLDNPKGRVVLARDGDVWRITEPRALPADPSAVTALLSALLSARAEPLAGAGPLPAYDLDPPSHSITLEGGGQSETVHAGKRSSFDGRLYVKGVAGVGLAPGSLRYELSRTVETLRERRLAPVDPEAVLRFELEGRFVLERAGEAYTLVGHGPADPDSAKRLITSVTSLHARAFVTDEAGDLARYGLAKPAARITLATADSRLVVRLSTERDGKHYAMREGTTSVAEVPARPVLEQLARPPEELRDRRLLHFDRDAVHVVRLITRDSTVLLRRRNAHEWEVDGAPAKESEVFALLFRLWSLRSERLDEPRPLPSPRRVELVGSAGELLGALEIGEGRASGDVSGPVDPALLAAIVFAREHYADVE